ncbi:Gfo/Idh/MocA family oxidoreductase [Svornostia abyssi]|uniref:Gfo/Idh/MocA family oxidoreductase n=1 Tax=Svornostia abyssi TaxID=2898438 RepID=A0ABY5PJ37_9ACTN|nr:Gfo/Idh/MocA family oxidoreductase [Parviterribacteraceae bacterium J379]
MPPSSGPSGAVIGLGMIGRHHARLLQTGGFAQFAGAVDPGGDQYGAVLDPALVHPSVDALLAAGAPDFAVVAVPTAQHAGVATQLARAGVHVLVEKPLAGSVAEAEGLLAAIEQTGVRGAVGHVERYNPALLGVREHIGEIGQVFLIATERVGPFPDRIRDVGVVMDLATHDLDLVRWLGNADIVQVAAQTAIKMGREHEDLVLITGRLGNGTTFNCVVDRVTPTKRRRTRILGERGMLEADTLTGDLVLYKNGSVQAADPFAQALRGVSEGDSIRFALERPEPLRTELETFVRYVGGDDDAGVVTLAEGLHTVRVAEAALRSAQDGATVQP